MSDGADRVTGSKRGRGGASNAAEAQAAAAGVAAERQTPALSAYKADFATCASTRDGRRAIALVQKMLNNGSRPTAAMLTMALSIVARVAVESNEADYKALPLPAVESTALLKTGQLDDIPHSVSLETLKQILSRWLESAPPVVGEGAAAASTNSPSEPIFSMYVRICCGLRRPDEGETALKQMLGMGIAPKLRSYASLLEAFADAQDAAACQRLHKDLATRNLECGEAEYASLVRCYVGLPRQGTASRGPPAPRQRVHTDLFFALLREMMEVVYAPQAPLLAELRRGFASSALQSAGWHCREVAIGPDGFCQCAKLRLRSLDLSTAELLVLARQAETLATKSDRQREAFADFMPWLLENGPYDVIVDGANVGFFNQNYKEGYFSHKQIDEVLRHFENDGRRPLLVLHERWFDEEVDLQPHLQRAYRKRGKRRRTDDAAAKAAKAEGNGSGEGQEASGVDCATAAAAPAAAAAAGGRAGVASPPRDESAAPTAGLSSTEQARRQEMQAILRRWEATPGLVYKVRRGNNDDWYWLMAAVTRGGNLLEADPVGLASPSAASQADSEGRAGAGSAAGEAPARPRVHLREPQAVPPTPVGSARRGSVSDVESVDGEVPLRRGSSPARSVASSTSAVASLPRTGSPRVERMPTHGGRGTSLHTATPRAFVVSNDMMRDHHFNMLAPSNFAKWRERHQVNFQFEELGASRTRQAATRKLHFRFPSIFSHRMQPSVDGNAWFFPIGGTSSRWMAAWRSRDAGSSHASRRTSVPVE